MRAVSQLLAFCCCDGEGDGCLPFPECIDCPTDSAVQLVNATGTLQSAVGSYSWTIAPRGTSIISTLGQNQCVWETRSVPGSLTFTVVGPGSLAGEYVMPGASFSQVLTCQPDAGGNATTRWVSVFKVGFTGTPKLSGNVTGPYVPCAIGFGHTELDLELGWLVLAEPVLSININTFSLVIE